MLQDLMVFTQCYCELSAICNDVWCVVPSQCEVATSYENGFVRERYRGWGPTDVAKVGIPGIVHQWDPLCPSGGCGLEGELHPFME